MKHTRKAMKRLAFLLALACAAGLLAPVGQAGTAPAAADAPDTASLKILTGDNIAGLAQIAQIGKGEPHAALWSPDGETVALATGTGVQLFDGRTLAPIALLPCGYARLPAWSADSALLAVGVSRGTKDEIQLWDVAEKRLLFTIAQDRTVSALWINQEKKELIALGQQQSGKDKYGMVQHKSWLDSYQLKNGKRKSSAGFQSGDKQLMNLSLSPGGKTIFGAGLKEFGVWNLKGKLLYKAPIAAPMAAAGVSDGTLAAIVNLTRPTSVQIVHLKGKTAPFELDPGARVGRMELDATGKKLLLYTSDGYQAYDLQSHQLETSLPFREYAALGPRLSADLKRLAMIDGDKLRLVEIATGSELGVQDGFLDRAWQVAASSDRLAASKGSSWNRDVRILLWDLNSLQEIPIANPPPLKETVADLFITSDGSRLSSYARNEKAIRFWDMRDGSPEGEKGFEYALHGGCVSADGLTLAVGAAGLFEVWPLQGAAPVASVGMNSFVTCLSLSADGGRVAASDGSTVLVRDLKEGKELMGFYDEEAGSLSLSPDGGSLAVSFLGKKGYSVKLYDADTGKAGRSYPLGDEFHALGFSPDGALLGASAYDGGLVFLDARSGEHLFTLCCSVSDFAFSPDGRLVVTASSDGTVRAWGVR